MPVKKQVLKGIGGVFIYCNDPLKLSKWYADLFNLKLECYDPGKCYGMEFVHKNSKNPEVKNSTVYSFMKSKRKLGKNRNQFMVNYLINDFNNMLRRIKRREIKIEKIEKYEYGKFVWISDPEGNKLEIYQLTKVF